MRAINTNIRWIATASCLLAITSVASADEGVVRITDANKTSGVAQIATSGNARLTSEQNEQQAAYARIRAQLSGHSTGGSQLQQVGYRRQNLGMMDQTSYATQGCSTGACGSACGGSACGNSPSYGNCDSSCPSGKCKGSACRSCQTCNNGKNKRGRKSDNCDSCYGDGYNDRMCTLFAQAPSNNCGTRQRGAWWHAQTSNYQRRNQKLSDHLFGWMIPSGCGGQGCPPFGKYHVTYANDPAYADARDGQAYGAQGYGTHMNVPMAPNVRQSYNYSWGTPASRITPIGQYAGPGPATAGQHQSW